MRQHVIVGRKMKDGEIVSTTADEAGLSRYILLLQTSNDAEILFVASGNTMLTAIEMSGAVARTYGIQL